jgi:hypothetical protein
MRTTFLALEDPIVIDTMEANPKQEPMGIINRPFLEITGSKFYFTPIGNFYNW